MDEFELSARIRERLARGDARVALGIGDDGAVLAPMARGAVLSVDVVVDGVHFDRRWLSCEDIGWRGYASALSDLCAMGADPIGGLLSMILPKELPASDVLAIVDGVAQASDAFGAPVIGGNLSSGAQLSIGTTVVGEAPERPLLRSGARVGDALFVTGTLGAAALGRMLLARGESDARFAERWRRPRPRFDVLPSLRTIATSAVDVSDGLYADLVHLCEASGVGATVHEELVPLEADQRTLAASIGEDALALALSGGEDYELLFTAPENRVEPTIATRIGSITNERVCVLRSDGSERTLPRRGYRHF